MKLFYLVIFIFIINHSFSQPKTYEKGKMIDSILVKGTTDETFQLFLPKTYDLTANHAIIFIYDPSGNGSGGIKPFIESAEQYSYILVCSNNSKNNNSGRNYDISNRLFEHVFSEFKIDSNQIYTAGFSGGARLASAIALESSSIQGVIGCGAGFSVKLSQNLLSDRHFSYVGLVGDEDMNYQEMFKLSNSLNKFSIDNELLTYEDGHNWPPQDQILRAMGWLELQAYKKGIRPVKKKIINKLYKNSYIIGAALESDNKIVPSVMEYERLIRNYSNYFLLDSIKSKINILKSTEGYAAAIKVRNEIANWENNLTEKFLSKFREETLLGRSNDNYEWWRKELKKITIVVKKNENYLLNKMEKRLLFSLMVLAYESSNFYVSCKNNDRALYCDKFLVILNPAQSYWYFRLAQSYARKNDFKNTILNLEKSLDLGFTNIERIKNAEEFVKFKNKKKFVKVLTSYHN